MGDKDDEEGLQFVSRALVSLAQKGGLGWSDTYGFHDHGTIDPACCAAAAVASPDDSTDSKPLLFEKLERCFEWYLAATAAENDADKVWARLVPNQCFFVMKQLAVGLGHPPALDAIMKKVGWFMRSSQIEVGHIEGVVNAVKSEPMCGVFANV